MKKLNIVIIAAFSLVLYLTLSALKNEEKRARDIQVLDSVGEDRAKYVKQVRESIKGREKMPADSVFKNIKLMKGVPAGRLLAIMDFGYGRSLGVSCGHCHNTNKWESDEKPQKQIAREMSMMTGKTKELLKGIKGLKSDPPLINCTTCHRGAIKPALDMD